MAKAQRVHIHRNPQPARIDHHFFNGTPRILFYFFFLCLFHTFTLINSCPAQSLLLSPVARILQAATHSMTSSETLVDMGPSSLLKLQRGSHLYIRMTKTMMTVATTLTSSLRGSLLLPLLPLWHVPENPISVIPSKHLSPNYYQERPTGTTEAQRIVQDYHRKRDGIVEIEQSTAVSTAKELPTIPDHRNSTYTLAITDDGRSTIDLEKRPQPAIRLFHHDRKGLAQAVSTTIRVLYCFITHVCTATSRNGNGPGWTLYSRKKYPLSTSWMH